MLRKKDFMLRKRKVIKKYLIYIYDYNERFPDSPKVTIIEYDSISSLNFDNIFNNEAISASYAICYNDDTIEMISSPIMYGKRLDGDTCEVYCGEKFQMDDLFITIEEMYEFISGVTRCNNDVYNLLENNIGKGVVVKLLSDDKNKIERKTGVLMDVGTLGIFVDEKEIDFEHVFSVVVDGVVIYVNPFVQHCDHMPYNEYFKLIQKETNRNKGNPRKREKNC